MSDTIQKSERLFEKEAIVEERPLQWWVYMIIVVFFFLIMLLLNYIVKKINDAKCEQRCLRFDDQSAKSTQVQGSQIKEDSTPNPPSLPLNETGQADQGVSLIFPKERNQEIKRNSGTALQIFDNPEVKDTHIENQTHLNTIYSNVNFISNDNVTLKLSDIIKYDVPFKDSNSNVDVKVKVSGDISRTVNTVSKNSVKRKRSGAVNEYNPKKFRECEEYNYLMDGARNTNVICKLSSEFTSSSKDLKVIGDITDITKVSDANVVSVSKKVSENIASNSRPLPMGDDNTFPDKDIPERINNLKSSVTKIYSENIASNSRPLQMGDDNTFPDKDIPERIVKSSVTKISDVRGDCRDSYVILENESDEVKAQCGEICVEKGNE